MGSPCRGLGGFRGEHTTAPISETLRSPVTLIVGFRVQGFGGTDKEVIISSQGVRVEKEVEGSVAEWRALH